jgi:hypothetical protein
MGGSYASDASSPKDAMKWLEVGRTSFPTEGKNVLTRFIRQWLDSYSPGVARRFPFLTGP